MPRKVEELYYRVESKLDVRPSTIVSYKGHQAYKIILDSTVYHTQANKSTASAHSANAHTESNFTISFDDLMEGVKPKEPTISLDENEEPIFGYSCHRENSAVVIGTSGRHNDGDKNGV